MAEILVIEDETTLARNLCDALEYAGHKAAAVSTGEEGLDRASASSPDVILLDLRLPKMDGLDVLRALRTQGNRTPVIVMTAHGSIHTAVEAMKAGANDFLTKPLDMKALQLVVQRVVEYQKALDNLEYFRRREKSDCGVSSILGSSPKICELKALIVRLAKLPPLASTAPPSVLITGETGTGKDLVARSLHYEGPRAGSALVHVNCAAVPDELFEAELFGHAKGAFTSAAGAKKGLMEVADGGTIFLDEIGHMKLALQAKLLTVIDQQRIRPVGSTTERAVNVHVIAATNRKLEEAIRSGEFREDLYHRLRVIPIVLPPLRERAEDIEVLARHFAEHYSVRFGLPAARISDEALELLRKYDWPGNVRELAHVLEHAVLMADEQNLRPHHLHIRLPQKGAKIELDLPSASRIEIDFESGRPILDELEEATIRAALEYTGHNLSRTARILGITREAVRYRMQRFEEKSQGGPGRPRAEERP